jgi:hypothetical protein
MADAHPIVIQQQPSAAVPGYGAQILVGALAGVLAWWLIETIAKARSADDVDDGD